MGRPTQPLAVAGSVVALGIAAALGGYGLGRITSDDLDDTRSAAAAEGRRQGEARGSRRGYEAGLKAGRTRGHDQAYKRAYDAELKRAGLAP